MNLDFLAQADLVTLRFEKAKRLVELAKNELEAAKQAYDELLTKSEEHGIPKNKLKKLAEDRIAALFEAGMVEVGPNEPVSATPPTHRLDRPKRKRPKETETVIPETILEEFKEPEEPVADLT